MRFYVLFKRISVISGRCLDDNAKLCAMELCLWLGSFRFERGSNSVPSICRPALHPLSHQGSLSLQLKVLRENEYYHDFILTYALSSYKSAFSQQKLHFKTYCFSIFCFSVLEVLKYKFSFCHLYYLFFAFFFFFVKFDLLRII